MLDNNIIAHRTFGKNPGCWYPAAPAMATGRPLFLRPDAAQCLRIARCHRCPAATFPLHRGAYCSGRARKCGDLAGCDHDLANGGVVEVRHKHRFPAPSVVIFEGKLKRAAAPIPSVEPNNSAWPASVVTTPALSILRIVLFDASARYRLPAPSLTMPWGKDNLAAEPVPSMLPYPPDVAGDQGQAGLHGDGSILSSPALRTGVTLKKSAASRQRQAQRAARHPARAASD